MQSTSHKSSPPNSANGLAAAVNKVASGLHDAVDTVAGAATATAKAVDRKGGQLDAARLRYLDGCRERVRGSPLAALGAALAAGFLISKLLRLR